MVKEDMPTCFQLFVEMLPIFLQPNNIDVGLIHVALFVLRNVASIFNLLKLVFINQACCIIVKITLKAFSSSMC